MKYIDKALECIDRICAYIGALLLVWMLFALSVQVIARYVFDSGYPWTEESTRYAMIWMVFIGAVCCTKQGMHVAVDALEEIAPKCKIVLKTIQYIVTVVYCGLVCYFSVLNLSNAARQTSPSMKIPMNYLHMVFPISMTLIIIYTLRHMVALYRHESYGNGVDEVSQALEQALEEQKEMEKEDAK